MENFVPTASSVEVIRQLSISIERQTPALVIGPSGSGKTFLISHLAKLLHLPPPLFLFVDEQTDAKSIIGSYECGETAGEFKWVPGILITAAKEGRWLVIEDASKVPFDVLSVLLPLIDGRTLHIPQRREDIVVSPNFHLFATITTPSTHSLTPNQHSIPSLRLDILRPSLKNLLLPPLLQSWALVSLPPPTFHEAASILSLSFPSLTPISSLLVESISLLDNKVNNTSFGLKSLTQLASSILLSGFRASNDLSDIQKDKKVLSEVMRLLIVQETISLLLSFIPCVKTRHHFSLQIASFWEIDSSLLSSLLNPSHIVIDSNLQTSTLSIGNFHLPFYASRSLNPGTSALLANLNASKHFARTSVQTKILRTLVGSVISNTPVLLVGDTGTGKTTIVQHLATLVNAPLIVFNFSDQTETAELIGSARPMEPVGKKVGMLFALWANNLFPKSFSKTKNDLLLTKAHACYSGKRYVELLQVLMKTATLAVEKSLKKSGEAGVVMEWNSFEQECRKCLGRLQGGGHEVLAFEFAEGPLLRAVREGLWIVLDECNLAQPDVLQRLQGLLDSGDAPLLVPELGEDLVVKRHPEFRLFACMNPPTLPPVVDEEEGESEEMELLEEKKEIKGAVMSATGAGKRDLPPSIRQRFTEIFVDEVSSRSDLATVVGLYLAGITARPPVDAIVSVFIEVKKLCRACKLVDGAGKAPHVSLRTLVRALKFAKNAATRSWCPVELPQALVDGLVMAFAIPLSPASAQVVTQLAHRKLNVPLPSNVKKTVSAAAKLKGGGVLSHHFRPKATVEFHPMVVKANVERKALSMGKSVEESHEDTMKIADPSHAYVKVEGFWINTGNKDISVDKAHESFCVTDSVRTHVRNIACVLSGGPSPVLLEGPTSAGKTSLVQFLATLTGHSYVRINNHEHTDIREYFGQYVSCPTTGQLIFEEGAVAKAARAGHWVILDELNLAPPEVLESLNRLLDDNRELFIAETNTTIVPHPTFRVFATQNPAGGAYGGRKLLSRAFRNRFVEVFVDDLPASELKAIIEARCALPMSVCELIVNAFKELQSHRLQSSVFAGNHAAATVRDLLRWGMRKPQTVEEIAFEGWCLLGERLREEVDRTDVKRVLERTLLKGKELVIDFASHSMILNLREKFNEAVKMGRIPPAGVPLDGVAWTNELCRMVVLLKKALDHKDPVLLVGETGTGKTTACQILSFVEEHERLLEREKEPLPSQSDNGNPEGVDMIMNELSLDDAQKELKKEVLNILTIFNCHQNTETADLLGSLRPVRDRHMYCNKAVQSGSEILDSIASWEMAIGQSVDKKEDIAASFAKIHIDRLVKDIPNSLRECVQKLKERLQSCVDAVESAKGERPAINDVEGVLDGIRACASEFYSEVKIFSQKIAAKEEQERDDRNNSEELASPSGSEDGDLKKRKLDDSPLSGTSRETSMADVSTEQVTVEKLDASPILAPTAPKRRKHFSGTDVKSFASEMMKFTNEVRQNCNILTGWVVKACQLFEWVDGPLVKSMRQGGFLLLDEISLADDAVLERLNSVLEPSRSLFLSEKGVGEKEDELDVRADNLFRFFATMNPGGDYGKKELSPALRNRFVEVWVDAVDIASEQSKTLISHRLHQEHSWLSENIIQVAKWFSGFSQPPLNVRDVVSLANFINSISKKNIPSTILKTNIAVALSHMAHGLCMILFDGIGLGSTFNEKAAVEATPMITDLVSEGYHPLIAYILKNIESTLLSDVTDMERKAEYTYLKEMIGFDGLGWCREAIHAKEPKNLSNGTVKFGSFLFECSPPEHSFNRTPAPFTFEAFSTAKNAARVVRALSTRQPVLLEGPPGVGKTSLVQALADIARCDLIRINVSEQTDIMDLLGGDLPTENGFLWHDGPLLDAVLNGKWVLLDELNLAQQSVLEGLNALLDHRRQLFVPELNRLIDCHPSFRVLAAQNPEEDGCGRKGLPKSFLSRFARIKLTALTADDLRNICKDTMKSMAISEVEDVSMNESSNLMKRPMSEVEFAERAVSFISSVGVACKSARFEGSEGWEWNLRDGLKLVDLHTRIKTLSPLAAASLLARSRLRNDNDRNIVDYIALQCFGGNERNVVDLMDSFKTIGLDSVKNIRDGKIENAIALRNYQEYSFFSDAGKVEVSERHLVIGDIILNRRLPSSSMNQPCELLGRERTRILRPIATAVAANWPVLIVGAARSGKSFLVKWLAAVMGVPLVEVSLTGSIDASELLGCFEQSNADLDAATLGICKERLITALRYLGAPESVLSMAVTELILLCKSTLISSCPEWCREQLRELVDNVDAAYHSYMASKKKCEESVGSRFEWIDSALVNAVKDGSWVILKNAHVCPASTLDRLNSLLEPNGVLRIQESGDDRIIKTHPNFRLFITADDSYCNSVSPALRNRCLEVFCPLQSEEAVIETISTQEASASFKSVADLVFESNGKYSMDNLSQLLQESVFHKISKRLIALGLEKDDEEMNGESRSLALSDLIRSAVDNVLERGSSLESIAASINASIDVLTKEMLELHTISSLVDSVAICNSFAKNDPLASPYLSAAAVLHWIYSLMFHARYIMAKAENKGSSAKTWVTHAPTPATLIRMVKTLLASKKSTCDHLIALPNVESQEQNITLRQLAEAALASSSRMGSAAVDAEIVLLILLSSECVEGVLGNSLVQFLISIGTAQSGVVLSQVSNSHAADKKLLSCILSEIGNSASSLTDVEFSSSIPALFTQFICRSSLSDASVRLQLLSSPEALSNYLMNPHISDSQSLKSYLSLVALASPTIDNLLKTFYTSSEIMLGSMDSCSPDSRISVVRLIYRFLAIHSDSKDDSVLLATNVCNTIHSLIMSYFDIHNLLITCLVASGGRECVFNALHNVNNGNGNNLMRTCILIEEGLSPSSMLPLNILTSMRPKKLALLSNALVSFLISLLSSCSLLVSPVTNDINALLQQFIYSLGAEQRMTFLVNILKSITNLTKSLSNLSRTFVITTVEELSTLSGRKMVEHCVSSLRSVAEDSSSLISLLGDIPVVQKEFMNLTHELSLSFPDAFNKKDDVKLMEIRPMELRNPYRSTTLSVIDTVLLDIHTSNDLWSKVELLATVRVCSANKLMSKEKVTQLEQTLATKISETLSKKNSTLPLDSDKGKMMVDNDHEVSTVRELSVAMRYILAQQSLLQHSAFIMKSFFEEGTKKITTVPSSWKDYLSNILTNTVSTPPVQLIQSAAAVIDAYWRLEEEQKKNLSMKMEDSSLNSSLNSMLHAVGLAFQGGVSLLASKSSLSSELSIVDATDLSAVSSLIRPADKHRRRGKGQDFNQEGSTDPYLMNGSVIKSGMAVQLVAKSLNQPVTSFLDAESALKEFCILFCQGDAVKNNAKDSNCIILSMIFWLLEKLNLSSESLALAKKLYGHYTTRQSTAETSFVLSSFAEEFIMTVTRELEAMPSSNATQAIHILCSLFVVVTSMNTSKQTGELITYISWCIVSIMSLRFALDQAEKKLGEEMSVRTRIQALQYNLATDTKSLGVFATSEMILQGSNLRQSVTGTIASSTLNSVEMFSKEFSSLQDSLVIRPPIDMTDCVIALPSNEKAADDEENQDSVDSASIRLTNALAVFKSSVLTSDRLYSALPLLSQIEQSSSNIAAMVQLIAQLLDGTTSISNICNVSACGNLATVCSSFASRIERTIEKEYVDLTSAVTFSSLSLSHGLSSIVSVSDRMRYLHSAVAEETLFPINILQHEVRESNIEEEIDIYAPSVDTAMNRLRWAAALSLSTKGSNESILSMVRRTLRGVAVRIDRCVKRRIEQEEKEAPEFIQKEEKRQKEEDYSSGAESDSDKTQSKKLRLNKQKLAESERKLDAKVLADIQLLFPSEVTIAMEDKNRPTDAQYTAINDFLIKGSFGKDDDKKDTTVEEEKEDRRMDSYIDDITELIDLTTLHILSSDVVDDSNDGNVIRKAMCSSLVDYLSKLSGLPSSVRKLKDYELEPLCWIALQMATDQVSTKGLMEHQMAIESLQKQLLLLNSGDNDKMNRLVSTDQHYGAGGYINNNYTTEESEKKKEDKGETVGAEGEEVNVEEAMKDEEEEVKEQLTEEEARLMLQREKARKIKFVALLRQQNTAKVISSNAATTFYSSSNPGAMVAAWPSVNALLERTKQLLIIYEEQPQLESIRNACMKFGALVACDCSPSQILANLEFLLDKSDAWESIASREVSLRVQIDLLKQQIVTLRSRQLGEWNLLRDFREMESTKKALRWIGYLVLLISGTVRANSRGGLIDGEAQYDSDVEIDPQDQRRKLIEAENSSLTTDQERELMRKLLSFLRTSPIGEYSSRLSLMKTVSRLFLKSPLLREREAASIFLSAAEFSDIWSPAIAFALSAARASFSKEIKDLSKLARWDLSEIYSLRATIHRSHVQLRNAVRRFDEALLEITDMHITNHISMIPSFQYSALDKLHPRSAALQPEVETEVSTPSDLSPFISLLSSPLLDSVLHQSITVPIDGAPLPLSKLSSRVSSLLRSDVWKRIRGVYNLGDTLQAAKDISQGIHSAILGSKKMTTQMKQRTLMEFLHTLYNHGIRVMDWNKCGVRLSDITSTLKLAGNTYDVQDAFLLTKEKERVYSYFSSSGEDLGVMEIVKDNIEKGDGLFLPSVHIGMKLIQTTPHQDLYAYHMKIVGVCGSIIQCASQHRGGVVALLSEVNILKAMCATNLGESSVMVSLQLFEEIGVLLFEIHEALVQTIAVFPSRALQDPKTHSFMENMKQKQTKLKDRVWELIEGIMRSPEKIMAERTEENSFRVRLVFLQNLMRGLELLTRELKECAPLSSSSSLPLPSLSMKIVAVLLPEKINLLIQKMNEVLSNEGVEEEAKEQERKEVREDLIKTCLLAVQNIKALVDPAVLLPITVEKYVELVESTEANGDTEKLVDECQARFDKGINVAFYGSLISGLKKKIMAYVRVMERRRTYGDVTWCVVSEVVRTLELIGASAGQLYLGSAHLSFVLTHTVALLLRVGLDKETEEQEKQKSGRDELVDGTGLAEGSGENDITEEIDNEDQMEGLRSDKPEKKEEKKEDEGEEEEDKAMDVEMDFDAPMENKEKREEEGEEEEDGDRKEDDVDLNDGGELDNKLWNPDDKEGEGEDDGKKEKSKEDIRAEGGEDGEEQEDMDMEGKEEDTGDSKEREKEGKKGEKEKEKEKEKKEEKKGEEGEEGEEEEEEEMEDEDPSQFQVNLPEAQKKNNDEANDLDLDEDMNLDGEGEEQGEEEGEEQGEEGEKQEEQEEEDFGSGEGAGLIEEKEPVQNEGDHETKDLPEEGEDEPQGEEGDQGENEQQEQQDGEQFDGEREDKQDEEGEGENNDEKEEGEGNQEEKEDSPSCDQVDEFNPNDAEKEEADGEEKEEKEQEKEEEGGKGVNAPEEEKSQDEKIEEDVANKEEQKNEGISAFQSNIQNTTVQDQGESSQNPQDSSSNDNSGDPNGTQMEEASSGNDQQSKSFSKDQKQSSKNNSSPNPLSANPSQMEEWLKKVNLVDENEEEGKDESSPGKGKDNDMSNNDEAQKAHEDDQDASMALAKSQKQGDTAMLDEGEEEGEEEESDEREGEEGKEEKEEREAKEAKEEQGSSEEKTSSKNPNLAKKDASASLEEERDQKEEKDTPLTLVKGENTLQQEVFEGEDIDSDIPWLPEDLASPVLAPLSSPLAPLYPVPQEIIQQALPIGNTLAEALRLVLAPSKKGRLQGDYKTGKRISMRKVISFIASNFKRDKIWLRRTKPSQREYQVLLAIDNSKSMKEHRAGSLALQSLLSVCQALDRLEVGQVGIASFGGESPVLHSDLLKGAALSRATEACSYLSFTEEGRDSHNKALPDLMKLALETFERGGASASSSTTNGFCHQLLLVISDGRFNKQMTRQWVLKCVSRGIIPVLIVIDSPKGQEGEKTEKAENGEEKKQNVVKYTSIFDVKAVKMENGVFAGMESYLSDFPFTYYTVVQDVEILPKAVTSVLKQWIELVQNQH